MLKWLLSFLLSFFSAPAAQHDDYVADVAAEFAYAALTPTVSAPVKPKVPTRDCTTCNGTGRVRSGDGHEWTKCPDCDPSLPGLSGQKLDDTLFALPPKPPAVSGTTATTSVKTPKSEPNRYVK